MDTSQAFAEFAAATGRTPSVAPRPASKGAPARTPARPLTEGERVNLNNDATLAFAGGIATALLAAPLAVLCPPAGLALGALAATEMGVGVRNSVRLGLDEARLNAEYRAR